jgi:hypothetical protein
MHTKLRHQSPAYASNQIRTAFGTARSIWLSLSAADTSLFWRVGPIHHRRNGEFQFICNHLIVSVGPVLDTTYTEFCEKTAANLQENRVVRFLRR